MDLSVSILWTKGKRKGCHRSGGGVRESRYASAPDPDVDNGYGGG